eukprot:scaffold489_cov309-Pavlova_lutheri.AAC.18
MSFSMGRERSRREADSYSESSDSDCVYSSFGPWEEENSSRAANMSIRDKVEISARKVGKPRYPIETDSMSELTEGEDTESDPGEEKPLVMKQEVEVLTPVRGRKKKTVFDSDEAKDGENAALLDDWGYVPSPDDTPVRPGRTTFPSHSKHSEEQLAVDMVNGQSDIQPLNSIRSVAQQLKDNYSKADPENLSESDPQPHSNNSKEQRRTRYQQQGSATYLLSHDKSCSRQRSIDESDRTVKQALEPLCNQGQVAEGVVEPSSTVKQNKMALLVQSQEEQLNMHEASHEASDREPERKEDMTQSFKQLSIQQLSTLKDRNVEHSIDIAASKGNTVTTKMEELDNTENLTVEVKKEPAEEVAASEPLAEEPLGADLPT